MVRGGDSRRRRSRWWWMLAIPAALGLAALVLAVIGVFRIVGKVTSFGTVSRMLPAELAAARIEGLPLEPAQLREHPPVLESRNAAALYRQLTALTEATPKAQRDADGGACSAMLKRGRTDADRARARDVLARRAELVRLAERAADKPRCDFQRPWEQGPNVRFPEYAAGRAAARMLAARAVLEGDEGRLAEALRDIDRCRRMGQHMAEDRCIIAGLVGIALDAIADRAFQEVVLGHMESPEALRLARASEQAWRPPADVRRAMGGEVIMGRVAVDMIRRERGQLENMALPASFARGSRQTRLMMADAWEVRILQYWRRVYKEMRAHPDDDPGLARALEPLDKEQVDSASDPTYILNAILMPVFANVWLTAASSEERHRLRMTMLDLLEYRRKHGAYPASLTDLPSRAAPDIFSGKPPLYRRTGPGFILYSVGQNKRDDGGTQRGPKAEDRMLDIVISWPEPAR